MLVEVVPVGVRFLWSLAGDAEADGTVFGGLGGMDIFSGVVYL